MALLINEACTLCDACVPVCPNEAIKAGETIYVIDPLLRLHRQKPGLRRDARAAPGKVPAAARLTRRLDMHQGRKPRLD
jgi:ferredoxin